jgi:hypothetical protein
LTDDEEIPADPSIVQVCAFKGCFLKIRSEQIRVTQVGTTQERLRQDRSVKIRLYSGILPTPLIPFRHSIPKQRELILIRHCAIPRREKSDARHRRSSGTTVTRQSDGR